MDEEAKRLHDLVSSAIDDSVLTGLTTTAEPKSFIAEDFHRAVKAISEQKYQPPVRMYSPNQYKLLDEDAKAFGIDQTDPQWDLLVQHEWAAYRSFERYLVRMGYRPD